MSAARDASAGAKLSPLAIASTIVRTQGVLGFWRGWTAACAHRLTHPKSPRRVLDCYWIAIWLLLDCYLIDRIDVGGSWLPYTQTCQIETLDEFWRSPVAARLSPSQTHVQVLRSSSRCR